MGDVFHMGAESCRGPIAPKVCNLTSHKQRSIRNEVQYKALCSAVSQFSITKLWYAYLEVFGLSLQFSSGNRVKNYKPNWDLVDKTNAYVKMVFTKLRHRTHTEPRTVIERTKRQFMPPKENDRRGKL